MPLCSPYYFRGGFLISYQILWKGCRSLSCSRSLKMDHGRTWSIDHERCHLCLRCHWLSLSELFGYTLRKWTQSSWTVCVCVCARSSQACVRMFSPSQYLSLWVIKINHQRCGICHPPRLSAFRAVLKWWVFLSGKKLSSQNFDKKKTDRER